MSYFIRRIHDKMCSSSNTAASSDDVPQCELDQQREDRPRTTASVQHRGEVGQDMSDSGTQKAFAHRIETEQDIREIGRAAVSSVNETFHFLQTRFDILQDEVCELSAIKDENEELRTFREWAEPQLV